VDINGVKVMGLCVCTSHDHPLSNTCGGVIEKVQTQSNAFLREILEALGLLKQLENESEHPDNCILQPEGKIGQLYRLWFYEPIPKSNLMIRTMRQLHRAAQFENRI
jgi:hypothetical protein